MICAFVKALLDYLVFDQFPESNRNFIRDDCIRTAEVAQGSRQGRSTQPAVATAIQSHTHYCVGNQAVAMIGAQWVSLA